MNTSEETSRRASGWFRAGTLLAMVACGPVAAFGADQKQHNPRPPQPMGTTPASPMAPPMGTQPMGSMEPPASAQPMGSMEAGPMRSSEASLVRTLLPTVVNISSRKVYDEPGSPANAAGPTQRTDSGRVITLSGSGFIVDPEGLIATNYHVIGGAFEIIVTFWDGSRAPAKLMAATKVGDIAVLKVDVGHPLPVVHWANSDQVQIGDPVIAIGNPLGIGMSVSSGIVSALNRDIMASPYDDFIQTDAPINHGNSGGPLFNTKGQVIGIDTAIYSPTSGSVGIGFAIPANDAQFVLGRLTKYGAVRPGWIGVSLQQVGPDIAEALGMKQPVGSILSEITSESPAEKAGLQVGDVILSVGSKPAKDTRAVMRDIAVVPAGSAVTIGFWRGGKEQELSITVADWPTAPKLDKPVTPTSLERPILPNLGLQTASLNDEARNKYGIDFDQPGVLVTTVARNTDAADRGLVAGDVILQVQDHQVSTPTEFEQRLNEAREGKHTLMLVLIQPKLQPETQAQTAAMPGAKASPTPAQSAMGLQWGPPKWIVLRIGNG
jgi:serine protease Do